MEKLPADLMKIIEDCEIEKDKLGMTKANVYKIKGLSNNRNGFLKIQSIEMMEKLENEKIIYQWLKDRLPVPEVIYYRVWKNKEYLVLSEVEGLNCSDKSLLVNPDNIIRLLAKGLKMIHTIDISDCPFNQRINDKIKLAKRRIDENEVNEKDFELKYSGKTAYDLYIELDNQKYFKEDLVFTHGDYCLPNIIINDDDDISGFIDMGRAGISDRYQDLALATRSIKHNLGDEDILIEKFFLEYGISEINQDKIEYFILLDEFF